MNVFRTPTPRELAERELAESERNLLQALTAASYAESLAQHHTNTINRLRNYLEKAK
jgi:hypothetical protein